MSVDAAGWLQPLFDDCADYFLLSEGQPAPPSAARDEFCARPPGVPAEAKFVLGYAESRGSCAAMMEGLRDYPQSGVWTLGLMLISPLQRRAGLGSTLYREFEGMARSAGAAELRLCVFDSNPEAMRFWQRQGFAFHRAVPEQQFGLLRQRRSELRKMLVERSRIERCGHDEPRRPVVPSEFVAAFQALRALLRPVSAGLIVRIDTEQCFWLDTAHRAPGGQTLFFGSVQIKKAYVSYHLMPVYVHPALLAQVSPVLRARMQGKSCFSFKRIDRSLFDELGQLTMAGLETYRAKGYLDKRAMP